MADRIIDLEFIWTGVRRDLCSSTQPCFAMSIMTMYLYIHYHKGGSSIDFLPFLNRRLKWLFFLFCWTSVLTVLSQQLTVTFFFLKKSGFVFNNLEIPIQRRNGLEKIYAQGLRHIAIETYVPYFLLLNLSFSCVYMCVRACLSESVR